MLLQERNNFSSYPVVVNKNNLDLLGYFYYLQHLSQIIRKPGSVLADHLSSPGVAAWIKRIIAMNSGGKPRIRSE